MAAAVEKVGGVAEHDYQLRGQARLREPNWLRTLLGEDFSGDVDTVSLLFSNVTDGWLENLQGFDNLRALQLDGVITDAGLRRLKGVHSLRFLEMLNVQVADRGWNTSRN